MKKHEKTFAFNVDISKSIVKNYLLDYNSNKDVK